MGFINEAPGTIRYSQVADGYWQMTLQVFLLFRLIIERLGTRSHCKALCLPLVELSSMMSFCFFVSSSTDSSLPILPFIFFRISRRTVLSASATGKEEEEGDLNRSISFTVVVFCVEFYLGTTLQSESSAHKTSLFLGGQVS